MRRTRGAWPRSATGCRRAGGAEHGDWDTWPRQEVSSAHAQQRPTLDGVALRVVRRPRRCRRARGIGSRRAGTHLLQQRDAEVIHHTSRSDTARFRRAEQLTVRSSDGVVQWPGRHSHVRFQVLQHVGGGRSHRTGTNERRVISQGSGASREHDRAEPEAARVPASHPRLVCLVDTDGRAVHAQRLQDLGAQRILIRSSIARQRIGKQTGP